MPSAVQLAPDTTLCEPDCQTHFTVWPTLMVVVLGLKDVPERVTVASAPLCDDEEVPKGFYLRRIEGVLWLRGYQSWSGHVWSGEDTFVFVRSAPGAFEIPMTSER